MKRILLSLAALVLMTASPGPQRAAAQGIGWQVSGAGQIDGLVDLVASPHAPSGLIALTQAGGWRALALQTGPAGPRLVDAGEAPFMGKLAPPEIIPDGRVGVAPGATPAPDQKNAAGTPSAAWFEGPTRRYGHGVLGDAIEAEILQVAFADRRILAHRLPDDAVFEDLEPRIVDADGDGDLEVLAIRTELSRGAAIALYDAHAGDRDLREVARSAPIGRSNRWLNPAGVADFDGDGAPEIAVIQTPHIGGVLIHYAWDGRSQKLVEERRVAGYSTHAIGSRALGLAAIFDLDGDGRPELILPRQDRRIVAVVGVTDEGFVERMRITNAGGPVATSILAVDIDRDGQTEVIWGLSDGSIRVFSREEG